MNKIIIKIFPLSLLFCIFFSGCNNLSEEKLNSPIPAVSDSKTNLSNDAHSLTDGSNKVMLSLSLTDFQVNVDEPVFLDFKIQNDTEKVINADLGQNYKGGFVFTMVLPSGKEVQIPQFTKEGISVVGRATVQPRQTYTRKLLLNEWFTFESPGEYVLKGSLINPVKFGEQNIVEKNQNFEVVLNIKPKSLEKLERTAATLYRRVLETSNYEEKSEAALALGYVNDPIAIPHLERLLIADKMVDTVVINALERIGGEVSVEALNNAIKKNPNSETALLCSQAIRTIKNQNSGADK